MDPNSALAGAALVDALPAVCRRFHVRQLDLFGSAAEGRFDPGRSDLDFLVTFETLSGGACADAYFGLREALAGLFGREVDLITEPALENPYLRRRVEAQRLRLFRAAGMTTEQPSTSGMRGVPPSALPASRPDATSTLTWLPRWCARPQTSPRL